MFDNPYNHVCGTICVIRTIGGKDVAFKMIPQEHWSEWAGCFSVLY